MLNLVQFLIKEGKLREKNTKNKKFLSKSSAVSNEIVGIASPGNHPAGTLTSEIGVSEKKVPLTSPIVGKESDTLSKSEIAAPGKPSVRDVVFQQNKTPSRGAAAKAPVPPEMSHFSRVPEPITTKLARIIDLYKDAEQDQAIIDEKYSAVLCEHCKTGEREIRAIKRAELQFPGDSGWQFSCGETDHTSKEGACVVTLAEVLEKNSMLKDYIHSPVGSCFVVESLKNKIASEVSEKVKLGYSRNTGVEDVDGSLYTNLEDVSLLSKLGYSVSKEEYATLEKTSEALDLYSYLEKEAGVPKEVSRAVDKGEAFSGEYLKDMDYNVPEGYEVKGDLVCPLEKKAVADPAQTILITGHSGAGKSTLAKALAEKLNLPLHRVDAQTNWDDLREHFEKHPELERKALTPGSPEYKKYINNVRKIVHKSLKEINGPAILEGTQVTTLSPQQLSKYRASILAGGDMEQSIAQRLKRMSDKAAKKGIVFTPEQLAKKKEESELVAASWQPGMEKFKKIPELLAIIIPSIS